MKQKTETDLGPCRPRALTRRGEGTTPHTNRLWKDQVVPEPRSPGPGPLSSSASFTLIEMLTVIAIIAILAGLLFPAIRSALVRAEIAKAQQAVTSLATAIRSYHTEYGKWPILDSATTPYANFVVDTNMVNLLSGLNVVNPPYSAPMSDVGLSGTAAWQGNPRGIVFHEFKRTDLNAVGSFVDPWGSPYYFRLDVTYANQIPNPFMSQSPSPTYMNQGFLIWSAGPDGRYNNTDGDGFGMNKDNVTSWR